MRYIAGKINWHKWDAKQKIESNKSDNQVLIFNDFIDIKIHSDFNHDILNYHYDSQKNILLLIFGVPLLNNVKTNDSIDVLSELKNYYLNKQESYLENVRGTFVALLIDLNSHKVILSTDSIGQLRLYYKSTESMLEFSSRVNDLVEKNSKI